MPLGDSITYGVNSSSGGGYRVELFHDALLDSHSITFVGAWDTGPSTVDGQTFPQGTDGWPGDTIDDAPTATPARNGISELVDAQLSADNPNIVLLMIGTNDVDTNNDLTNAPTRLGNLLDQIIADSPDALLVVAQITPVDTNVTGKSNEDTLVQAYNAAIPNLVSTRQAAGKHIAMVDMYTPFTADASFGVDYMNGGSGLHPNDTGYAIMGDVWFAAIRNLLR
jgi:lysophospholipase L1-like esterase